MNSTKGFRFAASTRGISKLFDKVNTFYFLAVRYSENTKNANPPNGGQQNPKQRSSKNSFHLLYLLDQPSNMQQQQRPNSNQYQQNRGQNPNLESPLQHLPQHHQMNLGQHPPQQFPRFDAGGMPPQQQSYHPSQQQSHQKSQYGMPPHQTNIPNFQNIPSQQSNPNGMIYKDSRSHVQDYPPQLNAYHGQDSQSQKPPNIPPSVVQQSQPPTNDILSLLNNISHMTSQNFPQSLAAAGGNQNLLNLISGLAQNPVAAAGLSGQSGSAATSHSHIQNPLMMGQQMNQPSHSQNAKLQDSISRIHSIFGPNIMPIPKNATNTVYVEGIPLDASEREVARKILSHFYQSFSLDIFRPYPGFKSVRLIPREKKPGEKVIFCFADFENAFQTTLVINTLQGYRFDKDDILGLQFSYAITNNKYSGTSQNV
eukprot:403345552